MQEVISNIIVNTLHINAVSVRNTLKLLNEGATIPFITRYRKEVTNNLDELQIAAIQDQQQQLDEVSKRKDSILKVIKEQGKLSPELKLRIENTWQLTALEDLYIPFKKKKCTRAEKARMVGLQPLADLIYVKRDSRAQQCVADFINSKVRTKEEALQGARDIIAEKINEDLNVRNIVRHIYKYTANFSSKVIKGKENEGNNYKDYFKFSTPLKYCASHQLLAIRRAEREGILRVKIQGDDEKILDKIYANVVKGYGFCADQTELAMEDTYKRLLNPSINNEYAAMSKEKADDEAIALFEKTLRQLLLAPPLGQKRVLALDPGYRTGCKLVCLDEQGNLVCHSVIYPHAPHNKWEEASHTLSTLIKKYHVEAIAIGNGTASRETKLLTDHLNLPSTIQVFVVSEQGASIYSTSAIARKEFPKEDATIRGAVSIGRRLMDPLAELVKIDPKSIGVGQYQYDVDQTKLRRALERVVENCVNQVGVNINTASTYLLTNVAGLSASLAKNIVDYRTTNGAFKSRKELLKVPRLGAKAYEQAAGFLRIPNAKNPLDGSAVHPERYTLVEQIAKDLNVSVPDLMRQSSLRGKIDLNNYCSENIGLPTLLDIMVELEKPNRDPREVLQVFEFDKNIRMFEDVKAGMCLSAVITNITAFGAFADIGIKENGLIHISQMSNRRIASPLEVVTIGQQLQVTVIEVDESRKRIALSIKK